MLESAPCRTPTQPPPDLATIRRQFDAWNRGDFDGWLGDEAHPDIEYEAGILVGRAEGEQAVFRGREELRQFFDEWHSQWKMDMTIDELEQVGELASADLGRARLTGVQSGATRGAGHRLDRPVRGRPAAPDPFVPEPRAGPARPSAASAAR